MKKWLSMIAAAAVVLLPAARIYLRCAARDIRRAEAAESERRLLMTPEERLREDIARKAGIPARPPSDEAAQIPRQPRGVRFEIGLHVAQGLRQPDEIFSEVTQHYSDWYGGGEQIDSWVAQAVERNVEAAKTWPKVTDCDRLAQAYGALRRRGLIVYESVDVYWDALAIGIARDELVERKGASAVRGFVFQSDVFRLMEDGSRPSESDDDLEPSARFRDFILPIWYGAFGQERAESRAAALRPIVVAELRRAGLVLVDRPKAWPQHGDPLYYALSLVPPSALYGGESVTSPDDPILVKLNWQRRRPPAVSAEAADGLPDYVFQALGGLARDGKPVATSGGGRAH